MVLTSQMVVDQISAYLQHRLSLTALVDWAEEQMIDASFDSSKVRDAVARLGLADTRAFGLTWEDSRRLLESLGYSAHVEIAVNQRRSA